MYPLTAILAVNVYGIIQVIKLHMFDIYSFYLVYFEFLCISVSLTHFSLFDRTAVIFS